MADGRRDKLAQKSKKDYFPLEGKTSLSLFSKFFIVPITFPIPQLHGLTFIVINRQHLPAVISLVIKARR